MTRPNTGELDPQGNAASEIRSYATGFMISLLLTVGAFAALLSDLSAGWKIALICGAAVVQIVAHLRNFLHLSLADAQSEEDLLLVLFSVCLLAIMAGGTWYIMSDLGGRMHQASAGEAAMHQAPTRGTGE